MVVMRRFVSGNWFARLLVVLMALSLITGAALALRSSQAAANKGVETRFGSRAVLAANFVSTYVSQLTAREMLVAAATLSGGNPTAAFAADVEAFGFKAAVLLDSSGRSLAIEPAVAADIGVQYGTKYAHLATALEGHVAVSNVVPSAVQAAPVVAFAVPFDTPSGRRVFSGAYLVSNTPLAAFLSDTTTLKGARLYLTDGANVVFASNGTQAPGVQTLAVRDAALGTAAKQRGAGNYREGSTSYTFVKTAIPGTPWSMFIAAPTSQLFIAVDGTAHWLPWLILAGLSVLIAFAAWLAIRLLGSRRHLADLNRSLATAARTDALTGLTNRAHLTALLDQLLTDARQLGFPVCVLMIDIDHFKNLNDTFGHRAGDFALRHVAYRLSTSLRQGDLIGRWGGEEFLAVLPDTDMAQGMVVAERLCNLVAGTPIQVGEDGGLVAIHTSVGIAEFADDTVDTLVDRADLGLYDAKAAGRNTVRASVRSAV